MTIRTKAGTVSICLLFPDLLGTYGDGGNATVLQKRLVWRGVPAEIISVSMGETVPETCDVYLLGGGEDQPQSSVTDQLAESKALHRAVDNGAVILAVCAGMQVLGNEFAIAGGASRPGLGLLDIVTTRGEGPRRVGEIVVDPDETLLNRPLTGYENHGGITLLGSDTRRLGTVRTGKGNDDGTGSEGAVLGRIVGTYLHGPVLARNPQLADLLLEWVTGTVLPVLDDGEVNELRKERLEQERAVENDRVDQALAFASRVTSKLARSKLARTKDGLFRS